MPLPADFQKLYSLLWGNDEHLRGKIFVTREILVPTFDLLQCYDSSRLPLQDNKSYWKTASSLSKAETQRAYSQFKGTTLDAVRCDSLDLSLLTGKEERLRLPCGSHTLLVREHYVQLLEFLKERQSDYERRKEAWERKRKRTDIDMKCLDTDRHLILTGQPGIGKSWFLSYLLVDRLLKGLPTVYTTMTQQHYIFTDEGMMRFEDLSDEMVRGYLRNDKVWYLADETPHKVASLDPATSWMIIQATSPNKNNFRKWQKEKSVQIYYMTPWTWDEVACVGSRTLNPDHLYHLYQNFTLYGPVPPLLLGEINPSSWMYTSRLGAFKQRLSISVIRILFQGAHVWMETEFPDEQAYTVILTEPDETCPMLYTRRIITPHVAWLITEQTTSGLKMKAKELYSSLEGEEEADSYRGWLFEGLVRAKFANRLVIQIAALDSENYLYRRVENLTGQSGKFRNLTHLGTLLGPKNGSTRSDSSSRRGWYLMPEIRSMAGVDGVLVSNDAVYLFQITVSKTHDVSAAGLEQFFDCMSAELQKMPWRLVFVVPEKLRVGYTKQLIKEDIDDKDRVKYWRGVEQWVANIPGR